MHNLFQKWRKINEDQDNKQGLLPLDILDFLVKTYAKNIKVKIGYFNFNDFQDKELVFLIGVIFSHYDHIL